jgi:hypothetical protein
MVVVLIDDLEEPPPPLLTTSMAYELRLEISALILLEKRALGDV